MTHQQVTHVILLTPQGRGAVASLLVAGPAATAAVEPLFHASGATPLAEQPIDQIGYGRWSSPDKGEEVVVCRRDAQRIEIHCHGGAAAASTIIEALRERGCRQIDWKQWVVQSTADPIGAAAEIALAAAPTDRTAAILWDQRGGALRQALSEIAALVDDGDAQQATGRVLQLLAWQPLGSHLTRPWRVVLAGRPNVGKSSLINALVGFNRAIVHSTPGTTRDVVTTATAIDGWPVELVDTAGLHASHEPLELAGIELARTRLATADLVVLVFDASRPRAAEQATLLRDWPDALCVDNKCDLVEPVGIEGRPSPWLPTSATQQIGMDQLHCEIARRLVPATPAPGQAVPFLDRQFDQLVRVRDMLAAGRFGAARGLLAANENWAGQFC